MTICTSIQVYYCNHFVDHHAMSSLLVTSYISFYVVVNISEAIFTVPCKFPGFRVLSFRKPENQWKQAETSGNKRKHGIKFAILLMPHEIGSDVT